MPTEEELEDLDFRSTFRDFSADFADLDRPADELGQPDEGPAAPGGSDAALAEEASGCAEATPPVVTEEDLLAVYRAHRRLASFLERGSAVAGGKPGEIDYLPRSFWHSEIIRTVGLFLAL
jgi:hypothetical protein